jgi:hypothetical protein
MKLKRKNYVIRIKNNTKKSEKIEFKSEKISKLHGVIFKGKRTKMK